LEDGTYGRGILWPSLLPEPKRLPAKYNPEGPKLPLVADPGVG
jgi:hypothetical protein